MELNSKRIQRLEYICYWTFEHQRQAEIKKQLAKTKTIKADPYDSFINDVQADENFSLLERRNEEILTEPY